MNFSPIQRLKILKTKKMCEGRYTSLLSFYSLLGSISQLDTTFQIVIINIINIIILVSKSLYKKYQVNNSNDISNNKPRPTLLMSPWTAHHFAIVGSSSKWRG